MSCRTILPTNIKDTINILDVLGCQDLQTLRVKLENLCTLHDPLKVDEKFLNLLADEYGAYFFEEFANSKRELIKYAQQHYKKLGTVSAIKEVFKALNIEAEVKEWFNTNKEPYTFDIDLSISNREITPHLMEALKRLIELTKNVRSHLDELILAYKAKAQINTTVGGVGEVCINTKTLEGYNTLTTLTTLTIAGAVGESVATAKGA